MELHRDDGFALRFGKAELLLQVLLRIGFIFGSADDGDDLGDDAGRLN